MALKYEETTKSLKDRILDLIPNNKSILDIVDPLTYLRWGALSAKILIRLYLKRYQP